MIKYNNNTVQKLAMDSTINKLYYGGDLGGSWGSDTPMVDFLIPAQVTEINSLPSDIVNLVVEATTPPTASLDWSGLDGNVYVPDSAVNTYKSASPNTCSIRIDSSRLLRYNNWTQNTTSTYSNFNYGSNSNGGALFSGYYSTNGEYWKGVFYWIYMTLNTLTDEQVQQVIDYNENL